MAKTTVIIYKRACYKIQEGAAAMRDESPTISKSMAKTAAINNSDAPPTTMG